MDFKRRAKRKAPHNFRFFISVIFLCTCVITINLKAMAQCTGGTCGVTLSGLGGGDYNAGSSMTICTDETDRNINTNHHTITICIRPGTTYSGTIGVGSGTVTINNYGNFTGKISNYTSSVTVTNYSGSTFSPSSNISIGGTFISQTGSTLSIPNASQVHTGANMTIQSGVTASFAGSFTVDGTFETSSSFSIASILTNNSTGTITIRNSAVSIGSNMNNTGIIRLQNALLRVNGDFTNNSGGRVQNIDTSCSRVEVIGGNSSNNSGAFFGSGTSPTTGRTDMCRKATIATSDASGSGFSTNNGTTQNMSSPACSCNLTALPVSFIYFKGKKTEGGVLLEWQTASEKDNRLFVVERSTDGQTFVPIAEITGNGTMQGVSSYKAIDAQPLNHLTYYRLKQVDFDGTEYLYSQLIVIKQVASNVGVKLLPNPAQPDAQVQLQFSVPVLKVSLKIVDIQGNVHQQVTYTEPKSFYELPIQSLPKGVYLIMVQSTTNQETSSQILRFIQL